MTFETTDSFKVLEDLLLERNEVAVLTVLRQRAYLYGLLRRMCCVTPHCAGAGFMPFQQNVPQNSPLHHDPKCEHGALLRALGGAAETTAQVNAGHDLALSKALWWSKNRPNSTTSPASPPPPVFQQMMSTGYFMPVPADGLMQVGPPVPGPPAPTPPPRMFEPCPNCGMTTRMIGDTCECDIQH